MAAPVVRSDATNLLPRLSALEATQDTTRREDVAALVPEAEALLAQAVEQLETARLQLTEAETTPGQPQLVAPRALGVKVAEEIEARARRLSESVRAEARPVEMRYSINSGVCGVYNRATGKVEWRSSNGGVAGVYNPVRSRVDWFLDERRALAVVLDPATGRPDLRANASGGIAGVLDPTTNRPRFESRPREGVGMIVDPATSRIVTNYARGNPTAGYIDPQSHTVRFETAQTSGVAVVYRDGNGYSSSCSFVPDPFFPRPDPFPQPPPIPVPPIPPRR